MNTPRIESKRASTSVRSPIIVNQLGAEIRAALVDHWSRPLIIDHPADRPPWEIAPEADVLLTRPLAGWQQGACGQAGGLAVSACAGSRPHRPGSISFRHGCSMVRWSRSAAASRPIRSRNMSLAAILGFEKRLHEIRPRSRERLEDHSAGLAQRQDDRHRGLWCDRSCRRGAGQAVRRQHQGAPAIGLAICSSGHPAGG